ncbi:mycothiol transferase [Rhodococcus olei]|uniref:Mycothiol transferase n=1 Tax=Rhodococcus olei TaxID=2161675 RepID=A0ABP8NZ66_9NOCA
MSRDTEAESAIALLRDHFERIRELMVAVTDGLTPEVSDHRPGPRANSIAWLLWHLTRVQDDHISDAAGVEQAWTSRGWRERFDLPFPAADTGYGHGSAEVAAVHADAGLLAGYHADVHRATIGYVDELTRAELDRIVDRRWDPPVTVAVRLVSVVGDCLQHLGQAAYVRGLLAEP